MMSNSSKKDFRVVRAKITLNQTDVCHRDMYTTVCHDYVLRQLFLNPFLCFLFVCLFQMLSSRIAEKEDVKWDERKEDLKYDHKEKPYSQMAPCNKERGQMTFKWMESAQANSVEHVKQPDGLTIQLRINKKGKQNNWSWEHKEDFWGPKSFSKRHLKTLYFTIFGRKEIESVEISWHQHQWTYEIARGFFSSAMEVQVVVFDSWTAICKPTELPDNSVCEQFERTDDLQWLLSHLCPLPCEHF